MAVTQTPRFALPQWSSGTDPYPGRTGFNAFLKLLEDKAAVVFPSGLLTNRPTAGSFGRFYMATDQGGTGRLYYDGGSGWIELNTNGGGGAGQAVVINGTAIEGSSNRSARADHTHNIPLATATAHGAMPSQFAALLENATATVAANAIIRRTSNGHVALPGSGWGSGDAVPKSYVDSMAGNSESGSAAIVGGALVRRWSSGHISGPEPDKPEFYATKRYVDGQTWDAGRITSGTLPPARVRQSQWAYTQAWGGTGAVRAVHVTSGYELCFYSSTERHKTNIQPWGIDPREVFAVIPVEFDRLDPETGLPTGVHDYGVRAEQAGKHLPMYLERGKDGKIEGWSYFRWTGALQVGLRDLDRRDHDKDKVIAGLRRENETLSKRIKRLEDHLGV